jgi:phosphatidylglycerol:prolipoprotein diacylglycerol transferase
MSFHGGFLGCVAAVMLFCRKNAAFRSCRSATSPPRSGRSGCSSGGSPISSTANCGAAADASVPWAMVFPNGGPLPRHPSQLYEAALEGSCCLRCWRDDPRGALKRPGLILGSFIAIYAFARIIGEFFREPDPQLGFLWGGLTMGMLLSVPMIIAGASLLCWHGAADRRPKRTRQGRP